MDRISQQKKNHDQLGDVALAEAFQELLWAVIKAKNCDASRGRPQHAPAFSYLMTPKQFDRITKICKQRAWPVPNRRGILIDQQAISHPLQSRQAKDNCTPEETLDILTKAYSPYSQIGLNKPKNEQGIIFNTGRGVRVGSGSFYAVAVLKVCQEDGEKYLAPVTAYHATEAKIRNIR